jgi:succinate dehydrogenase / fumarate reductase cytochrome b subunit
MSWMTNVLKPVGLYWFANFLTSSIGKKLLMSLSGFFLILFLPVHLIGNLQLLTKDAGVSFNLYSYFMTHNPFIKTVSYLLYFSILLHTVQGLLLWRMNRKAKGKIGYAVKALRGDGTNVKAASNMAWLGIIIFVFIMVHMYQFWLQMKLGKVPMVDIDGVSYKNLYDPVISAFTNLNFVLFYVISMIIIGIHLNHGFQSAFQTLGLSHKKYTPLIKSIGKAYAFIVPFGFAIIPIIVYGRENLWW